MSESWPAPAKLNLFLHVIGRRPDGYHELQTAFQLIDLADELRFRVRDDPGIRRTAGPELVPPGEDLAVRAAQRLQQAAGIRRGADIALTKRIPVGGGLGGGSSDAATTLVALNELWGLGWSPERLGTLALELGADVPVFVRGHSAWAGGVGEQLEPLPLPERYYAVVFPGVAVSTAAVFQAPELTRNTPRTTIRAFLEAGGRNDCAPVVARRYPAVAEALAWLSRGGEARLTGTGSCVFAAFADRSSARAALAALPARWSGFVVRGLQRSPLLARLAAQRASRNERAE